MAPSFTLFNQSFDSFGDGNYFNVDTSLQNDSFGMAQTKSIDEDAAQLLQKKSSMGEASAQQLLTAGSGPLTIGYSPVNSFGNGSMPASNRRGGNMMLLGDARSSSPTQVLGMYRSYSGGGSNAPRPETLDDAHMRMSAGGSFGQGPSLSYTSNSGRQFGDAPPGYYGGPMRSSDSGDRTPPFYVMLRRFKSAFKNCTFLLRG